MEAVLEVQKPTVGRQRVASLTELRERNSASNR
jgi:hypothetical protein